MTRTAERRETRVTYPSDTEILVERLLDAPVRVVWSALSDPAHLARWWGGDGFTTTTASMDFCPGGRWHHTMHGPDGTDYENLVTYVEIEEPRRIVYRHGGAEADEARATGARCEDVQFVTEAELIPEGEMTRITLRMSFPSEEDRDEVMRTYHAQEGGRQMLGRLDAYAERLQCRGETPEPIVFERLFRAPREQVWEAWTQREHLSRWFGPEGTTVTRCELDLSVGGGMLFGMQAADGTEHKIRWIFERSEPPSVLEYRSSFMDENGGVVRFPFDPRWPIWTRSSVRLIEHAGNGGGTLVRIEWIPLNATDEELAVFFEGRDAVRPAWESMLDRLGKHLAETAAADAEGRSRD